MILSILSGLISSPYAKIGGGYLVIFFSLNISFFSKCNGKAEEIRKRSLKKLDELICSKEVDIIKVYYGLSDVEKRYSKIEGYIKYSFFSGVGIIISCLIGIGSSILNFEEYVALILLVISGAFFSIYIFQLFWWFRKA